MSARSQIALCASLLLTPSLAHAAGWSTTDRSVVAMGLGGSGAAHGADPGSTAYNPAASAFHPGLAASAGLVLAAPSLSAEGPGVSASTESGLSTPPALHLRWVGEQFLAGLSLTVPFGSNVVWPNDWAGRFELRSAQLRVLRASAVAGVRFGDFSIAAGPFVDFGSLALGKSLDFIATEGQTAIDTRATGFGVQVAAFARVLPELDLGLSWHSRSQLAFSGYADFSVPAELSGAAHDTALDVGLTMPDRITLGGLYRVSPELDVLADVELMLWNTVDRLELDFADAAMSDVVQPRNWRPTITPRAGVAYRPFDRLEARAGLYLDPSPVPAATAGPSSPDSLRVGASLGAGVRLLPAVSLDLAYQLVVFTGVESSAETMTGVRYSGVANLIGAAVTLQLDP